MRDQSEDIADLLSDRRLQPQELASRLYYMYCHNTRVPVSSEIEDSEPVPEDIKRKLLDYRKFAIMPYDYLVEDGLAVALAKHGQRGARKGTGMIFYQVGRSPFSTPPNPPPILRRRLHAPLLLLRTRHGLWLPRFLLRPQRQDQGGPDQRAGDGQRRGRLHGRPRHG